jgi:chorismate synthase
VVRVAIKPTSSIALEQTTVDISKMKETTIKVGGRHDACIVPRAVPVVSAMMALVLCDFAMRAGLIPRVLK